MWHSCLGHPSLHIFQKFLSVHNISFPEEHLCSFSCNSCNINKIHNLPFAKSCITSSSPLDIIFLMVGPHPFHLLNVLITMLFLFTITQSMFGFTRYIENQMFIQPLSPPSNLLKTILPHTPKHNGYSECRHPHIFITGLTLLH